MNKIISVNTIYQDYSDCDSGLPSHWCAIVHHTGNKFAEHVYADTEKELSHLQVGSEFTND
ncbi:MAG TPA: hypothetical protein VIC51_09140 [Psychromonas sp.]